MTIEELRECAPRLAALVDGVPESGRRAVLIEVLLLRPSIKVHWIEAAFNYHRLEVPRPEGPAWDNPE